MSSGQTAGLILEDVEDSKLKTHDAFRKLIHPAMSRRDIGTNTLDSMSGKFGMQLGHSRFILELLKEVCPQTSLSEHVYFINSLYKERAG